MKLLRAKQVCKRLGISRPALHAARKRGTIAPAKKLVNGYFLYDPKEVERFDADRKRQKVPKEEPRVLRRINSEKDPTMAQFLRFLRQWKRWYRNVGGREGINSWPLDLLKRFVQDHESVIELIEAAEKELASRKTLVPICTKDNPIKDPETTNP